MKKIMVCGLATILGACATTQQYPECATLQQKYSQYESFCGDRQIGVNELIDRARFDEYETMWFFLPQHNAFINGSAELQIEHTNPDMKLQWMLAGEEFERWHTHPQFAIDYIMKNEFVENPNTMLFPSRKDLMNAVFDARNTTVVTPYFAVYYQAISGEPDISPFTPGAKTIDYFDDKTLGVAPENIPEQFDGSIGSFLVEFIRNKK